MAVQWLYDSQGGDVPLAMAVAIIEAVRVFQGGQVVGDVIDAHRVVHRCPPHPLQIIT